MPFPCGHGKFYKWLKIRREIVLVPFSGVSTLGDTCSPKTLPRGPSGANPTQNPYLQKSLQPKTEGKETLLTLLGSLMIDFADNGLCDVNRERAKFDFITKDWFP
jgi:hypothetical protein